LLLKQITMKKQTWYKWHSIAGIKLSIFICFILITGTLAVVSHEINWLVNPNQRVLPAVDAKQINWAKIYNSASQRNNKDDISIISAPIDDWFAAEVIRVDPEGLRYRQFYHPITGQYQGDGRWYNWQRFFRMSHRHLMMPTIVGVTIVCIVGLIMFFSLISGFFLIPKWWQKFFRKPRTNNRKTFWNDCHRLFGLWSSWLLFVVCITGIWYLIEVLGGNAKFPEQVDAISLNEEQSLVMPNQNTFEQIINNVTVHHNMEIKQINLPSTRSSVVTVQGQNEAILVRNRANNVIFNPITGEYLSRRFAQDQSAHVRISEAADPLHFGTFGGIYTKLIYFIFGLILSSLAISGTYLYGLKSFKARSLSVEAEQKQKVWLSSWRGMQFGRWLSISLITICLILTGIIFTGSVLL